MVSDLKFGTADDRIHADHSRVFGLEEENSSYAVDASDEYDYHGADDVCLAAESPHHPFIPLPALHSSLSPNFVGGPVFSYMVATVVLQENESVRVEQKNGSTESRLLTVGDAVVLPEFVRRLYDPPKQLDIIDIIAGGDGKGNRRERGIDPVSGMEDPTFVTNYRFPVGDRQYRPVNWHRLIDGVFVPDGNVGAVRLDSAGHEFKDFPSTDGRVYGSIWARAADVGDKQEKITNSWTYTMTNAEQFMPNRSGLLVFYANMGITLDIDAMRCDPPHVSRRASGTV